MTDEHSVDFHGTNEGNLVQAHTIMGDVHVHPPRPRATYDYLDDVRSLAPGQLAGRGAELAELAAFATAPSADTWYQWWQAPAWAGKTALFVHFVVDPPEKTRLVSFFITARHKGNDDRAAFVSTVLDQLTTMLGKEALSVDGPASERYFRSLLRTAAQVCAKRGERLILVVDGLDEDRSDDDYSIAGLLPDEQVGDMRVIVSGRPNRALPDDVHDDHPLKDSRVLRALTTSPVAKVVRREVQRELRRYLNGSDLEKDLLGFVAAAGGGLTVVDIAHLIGCPARRVTQLLETVYGRMFVRQSGRWNQDDVLILAHEELNDAALDGLDPGELSRYRARLHEWADGYRSDGWPGGTPDYLFRGYFRLLTATKDVPRMVRLATDSRRYDRMRQLSGGDADALADIRRALDLVGGQDPDLAAVARLAVHHDHLSSRNSKVPAHLPALLALLGSPARAEALARSIPDSHQQGMALTELARAVATTGDYDNAVRLARSLPHPGWALESVAAVMTEAGEERRSIALAETMGPITRGVVLDKVLKITRDPRLLDRIEDSARSVKDELWRSAALTSAAAAAAFMGDLVRAEHIVEAVHEARRVEALGEVAASLVRNNDLVSARALIGRLETAADPRRYAVALSTVVEALAGRQDVGDLVVDLITRMTGAVAGVAGQEDKDHALWRVGVAVAATGRLLDAERLLDEIRGDGVRSLAWCTAAENAARAGDISAAEYWLSRAVDPLTPVTVSWVAVAMAKAGDVQRAVRLIERRAEQARDSLFCELAVAVARAGDAAQARLLLERVEGVTAAEASADRHDAVLGTVAQSLIDAGDVGAAERVAGLMSDPARSDDVWIAVVAAIARRGEPDRAEDMVRRISTIRGRADGLRAVADAVDGPWERPDFLTWLVDGSVPLALRSDELVEKVRVHVECGASDAVRRYLPVMAEWIDQAACGEVSLLSDVLGVLCGIAEQSQLCHWADRLEALIEDIAVVDAQVRACTALAQAVARIPEPDRAHRLAVRADALVKTLEEFERLPFVKHLVKAFAAAGDLPRAERVARTMPYSVGLPEALCTVAAGSSPADATKLVVEIVRMSDWAGPLVVPVWRRQAVFDALEQELAVVRGELAGG